MAPRKENGQGTIYRDEKTGYWYATIQWTDSAGKTKRKKFSAKSKTAVKTKLTNFKKELLTIGPDIDAKKILFKDFANSWLETKLKNSLKPTSYERKECTFINQVYPHLGNIPIEEITSSDVQAMVNALVKDGLSYSSIKKAYDNVNGCLREYRIHTRKTNLYNPCEAVVLPAAKKRDDGDITFYKADEIAKIKAEALRVWGNGAPVYYNGLSIVILMYTGLRVGEYLALKWDKNIDFNARTISVTGNAVLVRAPKGSATNYVLVDQNTTKTESGARVIPMTQVAYDALQELRKRHPNAEYVATSRNGSRVSTRNLGRTLNCILKSIGLLEEDDWSGNLHALRHTFASMLFANGAEAKTVSDILGHADTKITENIYIHMIQEVRVKAIQDIDKYSS